MKCRDNAMSSQLRRLLPNLACIAFRFADTGSEEIFGKPQEIPLDLAKVYAVVLPEILNSLNSQALSPCEKDSVSKIVLSVFRGADSGQILLNVGVERNGEPTKGSDIQVELVHDFALPWFFQ